MPNPERIPTSWKEPRGVNNNFDKILKEISQQEDSAEGFSKIMKEVQKVLFREKEEGENKLKNINIISDILSKSYGNEYFVAGNVAYIPNVGELVVFGDTHGGGVDTFWAVNKQVGLLKKLEERKCHLLALGDYTDRGDDDIGTLGLFFKLKLRYPNNTTLLRGNHEGELGDFWYTLIDRYKSKEKCKELFTEYNEIVDNLPGVAITGNYVVAAHAGFPGRKINSLRDLNNEEVLQEMRWRDPFGEKTFKKFLEAIGAKVMIVGHHPPLSEFPLMMFDNRLACVFSTGTENPSGGLYSRYLYRITAGVVRINLDEPKERWSIDDFLEIDYKGIQK